MKLIITRHGETEENKQKIMRGHTHGTLSAEGRAQAQKLGERLKTERIHHIYSSDLGRAANTAREIGKHHPGAGLTLTEDLREKNLGILTGKSRSDYSPSYAHPTIETQDSMHARAQRMIDSAYSRHKGETVVFVGHNRINKALIAVLTEKSPQEAETIEQQHNTSVTVFEFGPDGKPRLITFNNTDHLS